MLLPIARMLLKNSFGAGELIAAAKHAMVSAALREVIPTGSRVNVSRLSVATGLTRKEIASLLGRTLKPKLLSPKSTLEQRAWRVLRAWHIDATYRNRTGHLMALPFAGKQKTFSELVRRYGGDVTPVSVLKELERIKLVTRTQVGTIRVNRGALRSRSALLQQIGYFAHILSDFAATVTDANLPDRPQRFFAFKDASVPTVDQASLFQRTFSARSTILLESFEQWLRGQNRTPTKISRESKAAIRIGLGIYLVQEDSGNLDSDAQFGRLKNALS